MTSNEAPNEKLLQQVARGIEVLVALQVEQIRGKRSATDMILMLSKLGCTTPEIMRFLSLPRNTVAPTISRAKAAKSGRSKQAKTARRAGKRR